jgi:hypothetical protein
MKKDYRILTEIGNLLCWAYKEKNKPLLPFAEAAKMRGSSSSGEKQKVKILQTKNPLFPLLPEAHKQGLNLFARKGSFLNQKTYDYLNSVSLKDLRDYGAGNPSSVTDGNTFVQKPLFNFINKNNEQKLASIKTRNDVIYQYLKTFSIFNKRKNGILIKYNQHIGYNFNSKNILLRGVEPKNNNYFLKNTKTNTVYAPALSSAALSPSPKNIFNIRGSDLSSTPLLNKEPQINKTKAILRELNRLKGVSGITGYNRSANNKLIKYSYKLLFYFFKSMYCLISKPVFIFSPDKVTIQLFYFLNIPKFKVFKWYSILNNKLIRQKWYSIKLGGLFPVAQKQGEKKNMKISNLNTPSNFNDEDFLKRNQLKTGLSYSNKEIINKVKLSWRIKKTLFRLNKKRSKVRNILFNLYKFNLFKVFSFKFKLICEILSNKFKKPVELQLIRIHQPFNDSNILVNLLSLNIRNKKFKTNVAIEKLYAKKAVKNLYDYSINSVNLIPSFLSGIKIRIGGRLMREPIIPRITTKNFERGASSPGKVNFLDTATITKKNRKGSYTIKISSGQNFF